jgi:hypothetical protein
MNQMDVKIEPRSMSTNRSCVCIDVDRARRRDALHGTRADTVRGAAVEMHKAIEQRLAAKAEQYKEKHGYEAPYWALVNLAREAKTGR